MPKQKIASIILREKRESLNLTQREVAKAAGITLQQYQRLECGERILQNASLKVAIPVCAVLGINPFEFILDTHGEYLAVIPDRMEDYRNLILKAEAIKRSVRELKRLIDAFCDSVSE